MAPPSLATEGFIHCSTADPARRARSSATSPDVHELGLLHLDPMTLGDDLRWEESRPGEAYPHVYRAIWIDEVVDVVPWRHDA